MQHSLQKNFEISQNSEHSNHIVNTAYFARRSFVQSWCEFFIYDQFSPDITLKIRTLWVAVFIFSLLLDWGKFPGLKALPFGKNARSAFAVRFSRAIFRSILCPFSRAKLTPQAQDACKRRWGVVQSVGHLTVNEDGEGSNPSAPAKSPPFICFD